MMPVSSLSIPESLEPISLNPKSSYERHAIPNPSRLDAARQIVDRQPPCDLMCWKVIHGWRLERRAQRLFPFFTGALQTLSVNTSWSISIFSFFQRNYFSLLNYRFVENKSLKDGKGDNKFVITVAPQKLICPKMTGFHKTITHF
jgi:hypothetical protein